MYAAMYMIYHDDNLKTNHKTLLRFLSSISLSADDNEDVCADSTMATALSSVVGAVVLIAIISLFLFIR